jgi:chemotaxis protein CheC
VIFPEQSSLELMRAILGRQLSPHDILDLEDEALSETGNVILNSWLATLANLLKRSLKMSLPMVIRRDQHHIFETAGSPESCILFVHVKFEASDLEVRGYVAIMMDLPSIEQLRSLVAAFMESLHSATL